MRPDCLAGVLSILRNLILCLSKDAAASRYRRDRIAAPALGDLARSGRVGDGPVVVAPVILVGVGSAQSATLGSEKEKPDRKVRCVARATALSVTPGATVMNCITMPFSTM